MNELVMLGKLGYNDFFDASRSSVGAAIEQVARVVKEHKGAYELISATGEYRATVSGKRMLSARDRDDYPAVGDWVIIRDSLDDTKVIDDILPRNTTLRKKYAGKDESQLIAANVDVAFMVESIDRDYSLNRFERYLVLARDGGVRPVVVLNKYDLTSGADLLEKIEQIHERFGAIDVLATSIVADDGLGSLLRYIEKGLTYCFLGSSGVGKSSLINKLLAKDRIATKAIGAKTGRGKHTTTAREMYITANGGIIIDNPGSREVGIIDAGAGMGEVFADIESIATTCKFKDCRHVNEPGCAVMQALKTGEINVNQYDNYNKLLKETEHYELSNYEKRLKDKKFGKIIKNAKKLVKD